MDGPATKLNPCNPSTPKRRRLVQSTLLPHKPQENDDKDDDKNVKDYSEDEQGEDCCGSERRKKKKKKKSVGKVAPRTKGSKRGKQQPKRTPKKNASPNGLKGPNAQQLRGDFAQTDLSVPDLRIEAKRFAQEFSSMSAGRPVHPFFSCWKMEKKISEPAKSPKKKNRRITCGPIHVFENTQDDATPLDWRNWTFFEETTSSNRGSESAVSYLSEGSVQSLNFDQFMNPLCASILQNTKVVAEVDEVDIFSVQDDIVRKLNNEPQSRFLQESLKSYYHNHEDKIEGCLWIDKYKPTKAIEVCGNDESVRILSDWLHLWHERRYHSGRGSSHRDRSELQYGDYNYSPSDYDSEDLNEEDSLQNVLLITGPIGSGKTAAVYACAQEQGFKVLELNASHCRKGVAVKQRFGDTLGSHWVRRIFEHTVDSHKKDAKLTPGSTSPRSKAADNLSDRVTEMIPISDDEAQSPDGTEKLTSQKGAFPRESVPTLILIEDVDILFPEDRGCIAAIQQIAETGRGPIILTSNGNNPPLPDILDRLHVSFSLPSPKELLCHLYMICVTEKVSVHPLLLEKFIQSCDRDIRKTIMHLQFWFHSERYRKDRKDQTVCGSLLFDLEAGHQIMTKIVPWEFPSLLSELIDKEVSKSVTIMEENSSFLGLAEEQIDTRQDVFDARHMGIDYLEAKKVEMLKRNGSVTDCCDFEHQYKADSEFSNSFGKPFASSQRKFKRKLVVTSSDSEDEVSNNEKYQDIYSDINKEVSPHDNNGYFTEFPQNQNCSSPLFHKLVCSGLEDSENEPCKYLESAADTCLNETCKSFDISRVPESSLVTETVINNGTETMSGAVSSGRVADSLEFSMNNELIPFTFKDCVPLTELQQNPGLLVNTEIPSSSQIEAKQDFPDENVETKPVYNVMDECSRVDFKLKPNIFESSPPVETNMVQNLWRKLRDHCTDLRQYTASEQRLSFQVAKLAYAMGNLMSEVDLLFHNHQQKQCDTLEPPVFLSDEATFIWYDEQMMMSAVAMHGFCFYTKHITDVGSKMGYENRVDLTLEMLASTTNFMALGKLSRQDLKILTSFYDREANKPSDSMPTSEIKTSLFDVIQSIVPARLSLALKGVAFCEYLSSLRQISRSEASRISQSTAKTRRQRGRGVLHYLSSSAMALSHEDISLLSQFDLYRNLPSGTVPNVEDKST